MSPELVKIIKSKLNKIFVLIRFIIFSKILVKIDKNRDNFINENELRNWIRLQTKQYVQKTTESKWSKVNSNQDEVLTFEELLDNTIGEPETCKLTIYMTRLTNDKLGLSFSIFDLRV